MIHFTAADVETNNESFDKALGIRMYHDPCCGTRVTAQSEQGPPGYGSSSAGSATVGGGQVVGVSGGGGLVALDEADSS